MVLLFLKMIYNSDFLKYWYGMSIWYLSNHLLMTSLSYSNTIYIYVAMYFGKYFLPSDWLYNSDLYGIFRMIFKLFLTLRGTRYH